MSWSNDKELSLGANIINWNSLKKNTNKLCRSCLPKKKKLKIAAMSTHAAWTSFMPITKKQNLYRYVSFANGCIALMPTKKELLNGKC